MKKIGKILLGILISIYLVVVIFLTVCLLNYNKFNVTELGSKTLLIMDQDLGEYKKGDLLIVYKNPNTEINSNDYVFFYDSTGTELVISYGKVVSREIVTDKEATITMDGNYKISSEYVIGKESTMKQYKGIGKYLSFLESRWGFLFVVILPIMLGFIYEIYQLIIELKGSKEE